jgi:HlyD family secretion protein
MIIRLSSDLSRPTPKVKPSDSADFEIILAVRENVVRVPTSALQEGARVLVAGADGRLQERRIKTGLENRADR